MDKRKKKIRLSAVLGGVVGGIGGNGWQHKQSLGLTAASLSRNGLKYGLGIAGAKKCTCFTTVLNFGFGKGVGMTRKDFKKSFLENFASTIPSRILKKYRIGSDKGLLWNLFAANLIPCFSGDEARREYDKADKTNAQFIEYDACWMFCYPPYKNPCAKSLPQNMFTAAEVDEQMYPETYIWGEDFSWCYVVTHEFDLCGPYFCYNPNLK